MTEHPVRRYSDGTPKRDNQKLKSYSKALRKRLTPDEARLWNCLRDWKSEGARFRRQVVLGDYIVDFACHRCKVIIELDGSQHAEDDHHAKDVLRDATLSKMGYQVVRIWNNDLNYNTDETLQALWQHISPRLDSPSP